ncbi:hypothetical protein E2C01_067188 [Portunus trituberculatus]|uniref:Uncharacterized protein n=1 Tax=Portunus trituberculatus TaxID=210409 RepID=A0A5B7HWT3_PORTR|nr:hypothetical protein [Portunus trituberculatus]
MAKCVIETDKRIMSESTASGESDLSVMEDDYVEVISKKQRTKQNKKAARRLSDEESDNRDSKKMRDARTVSESGKHREAGGDGMKPRVILGRGGTAGQVTAVPPPEESSQGGGNAAQWSQPGGCRSPYPTQPGGFSPPHTIQTGGQPGDFAGEETIAVPERDRLNLP